MVLGAVLFVICVAVLFYFLSKKKKVTPVENYVPVFKELLPQDVQLLSLINADRKLNGLSELIPETLLTEIAKGHTEDMLAVGKISHDGFTTRVEAARASVVLENVAYGYHSPIGMHNAYMNSEGHKKNILNKSVTHIGIYTHNKYNTCLFAKYQ